MTSTNDIQNEPTNLDVLIDLIDEHFPKGECQERGQAMVLVAQILMWHDKELAKAVLEARIDELKWYEDLICDFDEGSDWAEHTIDRIQELQHLKQSQGGK